MLVGRREPNKAQRCYIQRSSFRGAREREPGIHRAAQREEEWIPGSPFGRPGTTMWLSRGGPRMRRTATAVRR
jgi:hypothetical protein